MTNSSSAKKVETHDFGAETAKVLKLVIHSLYTNKDIFLRELVSNASDACDKLRYEALTKPELLGEEKDLKISVAVNKDAKTITVSDNGIGMSREELVQNLGTIAKSGTEAFAAAAKDSNTLIGQFGVGFYSAFMVAERVEVVSRRADEKVAHRWESQGAGKFTISEVESAPRGTSVTLFLRDDAKEYLDRFRLKHVLSVYSDHIAFPIILTDAEGNSEQANRGSALWTRPKTEITPEQYKEFYRSVAHSPEEPWLTLHTKVEGQVSYTALLFIPGMKPFDLFQQEKTTRVKLYVKRVFITEQAVELLPRWLRFVRGVIDSEDLSLNVSRETLQESATLAKIREAVTKKLLSEIKKHTKDYDTFWENFGAVLKEGLCESLAPKQEILEVCRFASSASDGLVSLEEYVSRMKPEQKEIYVLNGESVAALKSSPLLQGFVARGIEVLLLSDHVDDFWLTTVPEYKGKAFKSITRTDIDLGEAPQPKEALAEDKLKALLATCREVLKDQVRDVRATSKLVDAPACLSIEEGAMDMRLERFLREQKQLPGLTLRILEINPAHPLIRVLSGISDTERSSDLIHLLLDQARIIEGEPIADPGAFARRLNKALTQGLVDNVV